MTLTFVLVPPQGLEPLFDDHKPAHLTHRFSMVSKGCTLIHVPRSRFKEMADDVTMEKVKALLTMYPSDLDLCQSFLQKSEWDSFKHGLVEDVVAQHQSIKGFQNGLRNCGSKEHGWKCRDLLSHPLYTPLTSASHSPLIGSYGASMSDMKTVKSRNLQEKMGEATSYIFVCVWTLLI